MKSKRSKACDIKPAVRKRVLERDGGCCIFCGTPRNLQIAHFVARSGGGLGIEQNLVTLCVNCHREADQGVNTKAYHQYMCAYLKKHYPNMIVEDLVYRKGSM